MGSCYENAQERKAILSARGKELNKLIYRTSFEEKLKLTLKTIKRALKYDRPVIASSFGKDSVVLIHMVHTINNKVPLVFNNTGVNFRETIKYMKELEELWHLKIYELKPETNFWKIVEKYGYPKQSRNSKTGDSREPKCCKLLKYDPMKKFMKEYKPGVVFVGLCGDEGRQRRIAYLTKGDAVYYHVGDNVMKCIPIIWWTRKDVWKYHDINNIPRNPVYTKYNIERTGCICCTGFIGWEKVMIKTFPKLYVKVATDIGRPPLESFVKTDRNAAGDFDTQ